MHNREMIHQAYEDTNRRTLSVWDAHPDIGIHRAEPFYHPDRLAITSGNRAGLLMAPLLSALETCIQDEPLANVAPLNGMHFTFFAVTQALYDKPDDAEELAGLIEIFKQHCDGHVMHISELRLVALADQLLLAGIPDAESLRVRQALVDHLLSTSWAGKIRERFPHTEIPQLFWHSTLLRYSAQYLPETLREFFRDNQHKNYGSLSLPVKLMMTNYNWSETFTLA